MKKTVSIIIVTLIVIVVGVLIYSYLKTIEVTKVSLKCVQKSYLYEGKPVDTNYYRITKSFFEDEPINLLVSNPDSNNLYPYVSGINSTSPIVKDIKFERKYYYPNYYTFVTNPRVEENEPLKIQVVTYIKRDTLEIESFLTGDTKMWSDGKCEIIPNSVFDKDFESKKNEKQKKKKI